jgi:hypothetical protein
LAAKEALRHPWILKNTKEDSKAAKEDPLAGSPTKKISIK